MLCNALKQSRKHQPQLFLFLIIPFLLCIPTSSLSAEGALRQEAPGLIAESKTGLVWQEKRSHKKHSPDEVQQYLTQLNQGPYHDWRLPSKWELYDFFMIFDLKKDGGVNLKLEGSYWLKDDNGKLYPASWEQGDQCGAERTFYKTKSGYVRAVRP